MAKSEGREFTDEELTTIEAKGAEITELKTRIERIEASEKSLKDLVEFGKSDDSAEDNPDDFKDVPSVSVSRSRALTPSSRRRTRRVSARVRPSPSIVSVSAR